MEPEHGHSKSVLNGALVFYLYVNFYLKTNFAVIII